MMQSILHFFSNNTNLYYKVKFCQDSNFFYNLTGLKSITFLGAKSLLIPLTMKGHCWLPLISHGFLLVNFLYRARADLGGQEDSCV